MALVALVAGQQFNARRPSRLDGSANALPQAGVDDRQPGGEGTSAAPDISAMSPRQRASALFDRVMRLHEEGKKDSVLFFAPMAIAAHQLLDTLDTDARYDLGRVAEISGAADLAAAQADTILRSAPSHLLGLILAANAAALRHDTKARLGFVRRFLAVEPSETKRPLPEYLAHRVDVVAAKRDFERTR